MLKLSGESDSRDAVISLSVCQLRSASCQFTYLSAISFKWFVICQLARLSSFQLDALLGVSWLSLCCQFKLAVSCQLKSFVGC